MAKPSVSVSDELLEDFDDAIWQRKVNGELDRDADRSQVIRQLMREFIEETEGVELEEDLEGNSKAVKVATTTN